MRAPLAAVLLLAAALAPQPARAQRDTLRLGAPRDTVVLTSVDTAVAPARDPRWSTPFAVETSGQVMPQRTAREVVWLDADSVRARRRAARLAAGDSVSVDSTTVDSASAPADSAEVADTVAPPPPPRRSRRAAAADSAAARDSTSAARRAAARRTAARDSVAGRRAASADTTGRARPATTRPRTHRVASGETLSGIARRYAVTTAQLRALNPDLADGLDVGTLLRLPAGARAPGQAAAPDSARRTSAERTSAERTEPAPRRPSTATPTSARGRRTHTVVAHETLFGIARRYGVSVDALKAANRLTGDALRTGQTLVIPAAAPR
jgi:LysM repeat protein